MKLSLSQSYYKIRIILTFCLVTITLVLILSFLSYRFVRELYLDQLSDQVKLATTMISRQIDRNYLDLLQVGTPLKSTSSYFANLFSENINSGFHSQIFIFNKDLGIEVSSDSNLPADKSDPILLLNQKEISGLEQGSSTVSIPFKGDDGKWYLWGFMRLDKDYWIALKENAAKLERVEDFASEFFYIGMGGIILTLLIAWLMARSITKPVDRLVQFSKEIGNGNFLSSVPKDMHGELKILSDSMDKMKKDIEAHNKEKENMLAQIAHEIRNPLGGIELLANLTKEDLEKENNFVSPGVDYLTRIICEINSLKTLITSYLNFSRPLPASPEWINMHNFLTEIEENFKTSFSKNDIDFSFNSSFEKIWFDPSHLKQIFLNLITNSMESLTAGGNICISAFIDDKKWKILFSDDGPGVHPENLNKIFEPFFTTKKNGTGLGLAICKKLCNENKADLKAENNEGNGSKFTIIKGFSSGYKE
jgi:signal transduction histidine kinase